VLEKIDKTIKALIAKLLPTPLSIGVEENNSFLKVVLVKKDSPTQALLLDYSIIPLMPEDKDPLKKIKALTPIGKALSEKKFLSANEAKLTVSGQEVDGKRITLPFMPKEEIPQALRWEAKEHFLLDVDDSILDFELLGETTDPDGSKHIEVLSSVATKNIIDKKINLFKNTETLPSLVNTVAYGLCNLYKLSALSDQERPIGIIDMGNTTTTITIIKEGTTRFVRQCGCAGSDFTKAMTGVLVSDKGRVELSPEKAEELKRKIGIPDETADNAEADIPMAQLAAMIRPVLEKLESEIKRSFDYYASQFNEGSVSKVYLTGGTSKLKHIDSDLSKRLGIPVEYLSFPKGLKSKLSPEKANTLKDDFPFITSALGIALASPTGPNLIPEHYKKERLNRIEKLIARSIFILTCIVMLGLYFLELGNVKLLKDLLVVKKGEEAKIHEAHVLHSKILQKNEIVEKTLKNQPPFYYIFKALSSITPDDAYLESIDIKDKASVLTLGGIVTGSNKNEEKVLATFLKNLERSPFFTDVYLISSQDIKISDKSGLEFEIRCKLRK